MSRRALQNRKSAMPARKKADIAQKTNLGIHAIKQVVGLGKKKDDKENVSSEAKHPK